MLNVIMCTIFFCRRQGQHQGKNILTNRQTEKASKQDKQTDNHFNQQRNQSETGGGGMLTISRRERNIHQLVLVVLVAKGGNCTDRACLFGADSKLQAEFERRGKGWVKH